MNECIADVQMSVKIRISTVEAPQSWQGDRLSDRELKITSQVKDEESYSNSKAPVH
jgi:hypothetical protein